MKSRWMLVAAWILAFCSSRVFGEELQAQFAAAPAEFSPVPIWWWSGDRIERGRLKYELERIAAGGIHNAIILNLAPSGPLYGSAGDEPPFLSEEWWDLFGYAVQEGKRVGVRIWFYDQLGFSGAGLQARVVRDHPKFRGIELRREVRDVAGPAEVELRTPAGGTALAAFVAAIVEEPSSEGPSWIWDRAAGQQVTKRYFRRTFDLAAAPARAQLSITCDNGYVLDVNGAKIGEEHLYEREGWSRAEQFDVARHLRVGKNVIAVEGENLGGEAGLLLELVPGDRSPKDSKTDASKPKEPRIVSDGQFRMSVQAPANWTAPDFDDGAWKPADVLGAPPMAPWGHIAGMASGADSSLGRKIKNVRNVTSEIADGRVRAKVAAGRHRVQLFYTVPGGFDYHDPAACAALMSVVHGEMEKRFGGELGKEIAGSFQDEFPKMPRYSRRFAEEFRRRNGYDLLERLPALYDDVSDGFGDAKGPTIAQIRCDANRVAAQLCEEAFFIPLHQWHEKHGLLCGYDQTVRNADPVGGESYYVDYFRTMRHYSVPGNDQSGSAKPHQSIADLYERPRVWLEGFHSSGWGQTLEEIATLLRPWLAEGSTLYDPHAIYYSTHGSFWEWAPPDNGWRQPYFVHYPMMARYVSRLCYMLTRGRHVVDVALLHPASTVHAYSGFGSALPAAQRASEAYWAVQESFRKERMDYIIADEDSIQRATIKDGALAVGAVQLRVVVLPAARVLEGKTLAKLAEFAGSGGTVIIAGEPPAQPADRTIAPEEFSGAAKSLQSRAVSLEDPAQTAEAVLKKVPRDLAERLPFLHRRVGDRDFYFALSDDSTAPNWDAEFAINRRELWKSTAAKGGRMSFHVAANGVPERWDAVGGKVIPVYNYRRAEGRTCVEVELGDSPAPLIAIRPAKTDEPIAIESDLQILDWQRKSGDAEGVAIRGLERLDFTTTTVPSEHRVRVEFSDATFEGSQRASPPQRIDVTGPFASRLAPTCDNLYGDFAWPPSPGPIPVEVRSFRYHLEQKGEPAAQLASPDLDDSRWEAVIASFGPRAEWAGLMAADKKQRFETIAGPQALAGASKPLVYSLRLGINEDPIYPSALGGKGRIPEEFIELGPAKAGDVYFVRTNVTVPNGAAPLAATLRIGGEARKRAFLNGEEVKFGGNDGARTLVAKVTLRPGTNRLELLAARVTDGRLRLFYQFLPAEGVPPDPQWIWSATPSKSGKVRFAKAVAVPGEIESAAMVVALGEAHQIRINGKLVADQGDFEPYFMSRAERYPVTAFLHQGENRIEIEAHDPGHPVGLLLDGLIQLKDKKEIVFVSDASFAVTAVGEDRATSAPARILAGPSQGYMGETAALLLRPRPHPLPEAGWLLNQPPPPAPFNQLVFSVGEGEPPVGWYRFLVPPGATLLALNTPGQAELYVNGEAVALERRGATQTARLPQADAPRRVAALRIKSVRGFVEGAAITAPITFELGPGQIPLGSWDEIGLPHYCGGVCYTAEVTLPESPSSRRILDLGRVRGSADVKVNGKECGVCLWHPYRFDITDAAKVGKNQVEIRVFNTLGPHFGVGHPSAHVYEGQTRSGLFGPVSINAVKVVEMSLKKIR